MCYSAQIEADYRRFTREYGAAISLDRFIDLFWQKRKDGGWARLPKAMRSAFAEPRNEREQTIADLVAAGDREEANRIEEEIFRQKARLANAQRSLASKPTKKAENDQRIATDKIARAQVNLANLQRSHLVEQDSRIYPGYYAPVMVMKGGERVVVPMRYQCRLPGWTESTERKMPGTYNARRDNLEGAWRQLFGYRHGIMVVRTFFENVARHRVEHRELTPDEKEENVVLQFRPTQPRDMLVACLWSFSRGQDGEGDLLSFAAITDDPPAEVAAAGHDRCIVPIKPENIDAWLSPDPKDLPRLYGVLSDREPTVLKHRLAA